MRTPIRALACGLWALLGLVADTFAAAAPVGEDAVPEPARCQPLSLHREEGQLWLRAGALSARVGLRELDLAVEVAGEPRLLGLELSVELNGRRLRAQTVERHVLAADSVELHGWLSRDDALGYVLRLQLLPDGAGLAAYASAFDRQLGHPTGDGWDPRWAQRRLGQFELRLRSATTPQAQRLLQRSAYSGGDPERDPVIETRAGAGSPVWEIDAPTPGALRLRHAVDDSGATWLRLRPRRSGTFELSLLQTPLGSPYPAANRLPVRLKHVDGVDEWTLDQGQPRLPLGRFRLDAESYLQIAAAGEEGDIAVFEALELVDAEGQRERLGARRIDGRVATAEGMALWIPGFWRKAPIEAGAEGDALYWRGLLQPQALGGGAGVSLDFGLAFDSTCTLEQSFQTLLEAPPLRQWPQSWLALDGMTVDDPRHARLLQQLPEVLEAQADWLQAYGWRQHGDYPVGPGYFQKGEPQEDYSGLQYDLGTGLLLAWLQSGDPRLWRLARAAARSALDTQVVKFEPYAQKRSGAGLRKGMCPVEAQPGCREPIPEYNYHARALLLYAALSGEAWPREVAQMQIDNSAYFAHTRQPWLLDSARPLAWTLRNLVYGARAFPQGTRFNGSRESGYPRMAVSTPYASLLRTLMDALLDRVDALQGLPPEQPVWQGQLVEGLILAADSGLLTPAQAEHARAAALQAVQQFRSRDLRRLDGGWQIRYSHFGDDFVPADTYGALWLTPMVWAWQQSGRPEDPELFAFRDWLLDIHLRNRPSDPGAIDLRSARALSVWLSFPAWGLQQLHAAEAAPRSAP